MKRCKIISGLILALSFLIMTTSGCQKMFLSAARKGGPIFQAEFNGQKIKEVFGPASTVMSKIEDDTLIVTAPLADARYVEVQMKLPLSDVYKGSVLREPKITVAYLYDYVVDASPTPEYSPDVFAVHEFAEAGYRKVKITKLDEDEEELHATFEFDFDRKYVDGRNETVRVRKGKFVVNYIQ